MSIFGSLIQVGSNVMPLPDFSVDAENEAWLNRMTPGIGGLIGAAVRQIKTEGVASIQFPSGAEIVLYQEGKCCSYSPEMIQAKLASLTPEDLAGDEVGGEKLSKWGDGVLLQKLIEMMVQLMPIIIQVLPFFLEPEPTPEPTPDTDVV